MKSKILFTVLILFFAGEAVAKQWAIVPLAKASRKSGVASMAALRGLALSASIGKLDIHKTADSETAPVAPLGYSVEEVKPVKMFSNDPHYPSQWNLTRVMAERGWSMAAGISGETVVAIVDTGIDPNHPDLASQIVGGGNFVDYGGSAVLPAGSWADDNAHGTFCASLVAAASDNGVGMAGMGRGVKLLAVKVLDGRGYGTDFGVAQGMVWAIDEGAKVLSISLGTNQFSAVMEYAVQYAHDNGVLVVAASGNSGVEEFVYPAAFPGVLAVGSSTRKDTRASYSTYSSRLGLLAPGGDSADRVLGAVPGGGYSTGAGTSFACPQVAGAAAMYMALNPRASAGHVFAALTGTADPIDMAPGKSLTSGWGRLNVARLMGMDVEPNVFGIEAVSGAVPSEGGSVKALVGAGEPPAPSAANPDPSQVDKVWAVVLHDGNELFREELSSMGGNDWTAQVNLPQWEGSSQRSLALGYQAVDSSGNSTAMFLAGTLVQAAGSVLPSFSHNPPASLAAGKSAVLKVVQYPVRPTMSDWTLHLRNSGGDWQALAGDNLGDEGVAFNVPAESVKIERLEYYFSCVDGGGNVIKIHGSNDPYSVSVYKAGEPMKLKPLSNPATELCLRLISDSQGVASVDFFSVSGEKVGGVRVELNAGENRVCLGEIVASGVYFGVARMEGSRSSKQVKLAIKR